MITITVCTQKGGVSKTTTAEALILGLRRKGFKVLSMDLDQQGNLTGFFNPKAKLTVFDLLDGTNAPEECIENDLVAGGLRLRYLEEYFKQNSLTAIGDALKPMSKNYDFLIIDTPPAINTVVLAALAISDYVVMPTEPTKDSLDGILKTIQAVEATKEKSNPNIKLLGVLMVKFKERYTLHKQFKDALASSKKIPVYDTVIRESQAINIAKTKNADFFGKDYMHANAVQDYRKFVKETLDKIRVKAPEKD